MSGVCCYTQCCSCSACGQVGISVIADGGFSAFEQVGVSVMGMPSDIFSGYLSRAGVVGGVLKSSQWSIQDIGRSPVTCTTGSATLSVHTSIKSFRSIGAGPVPGLAGSEDKPPAFSR